MSENASNEESGRNHGSVMPAEEWRRLPGESAKLYEFFTIYRMMERNQRTILAAFRKSRPDRANAKDGAERNWYTFSDRWDWAERAQAWDEHERRRAEAAAEKLFEERYAQLCQEKIDLRFKKLAIGKRILQRVEDMLNVPHVQVQTEPGPDGEITIVKPHKWNAGDIARLGSAGVELLQDAMEDVRDQFGDKAADRQRVPEGELPFHDSISELLKHATDILANAKHSSAAAGKADNAGATDAGADRVGETGGPAGQQGSSPA